MRYRTFRIIYEIIFLSICIIFLFYNLNLGIWMIIGWCIAETFFIFEYFLMRNKVYKIRYWIFGLISLIISFFIIGYGDYTIGINLFGFSIILFLHSVIDRFLDLKFLFKENQYKEINSNPLINLNIAYQDEIKGHKIDDLLEIAKNKNDIKKIREYETSLQIGKNLNKVDFNKEKLNVNECNIAKEGLISYSSEYHKYKWLGYIFLQTDSLRKSKQLMHDSENEIYNDKCK